MIPSATALVGAFLSNSLVIVDPLAQTLVLSHCARVTLIRWMIKPLPNLRSYVDLPSPFTPNSEIPKVARVCSGVSEMQMPLQ